MTSTDLKYESCRPEFHRPPIELSLGFEKESKDEFLSFDVSYLKITPETLSRSRKLLAFKPGLAGIQSKIISRISANN